MNVILQVRLFLLARNNLSKSTPFQTEAGFIHGMSLFRIMLLYSFNQRYSIDNYMLSGQVFFGTGTIIIIFLQKFY